MSFDLFPPPTASIDQRACFVLMPFADPFNALYVSMKDFVEEYCGLKCMRADEIFGSNAITVEIWKHINEARFLIADLTGRNPNVFYELGLAHALRKNVILLTQEIKDVPFDLQHIGVIEYEADQPQGLPNRLLPAIRTYISTARTQWTHPDAGEVASQSVRITDVRHPQRIECGKEFEIEVRARNEDTKIREGYCSISFPNGVEGFPVPPSPNVFQGGPGDKWCGGQVRLRYPIVEKADGHWLPGIEHLLQFRGSCPRKGLFWFEVSTSSREIESNQWDFDPPRRIIDIDQRRQPVYCVVMEVV